MKFENISSLIGHVPFIAEKNARYLYDLILNNELTNILELGFAHGTSTCYMAAALQELGKGKITSVDLKEAEIHFDPSVEDLLAKTDLSEFVEINRMKTGYNWFLHNEIVKNTTLDSCKEIYDLCIIDGPKNWTIDGSAFFLADKLLKKDGWIIFDDYEWTYSSVNHKREKTDGITHRMLSEEEQEIPHIKEVFELLVKQHPNYGNLIILEGEDWAIAQKTKKSDKSYNIINRHTTRDVVGNVLYKFYRKFNKFLQK